jgi:hypothetical protein
LPGILQAILTNALSFEQREVLAGLCIDLATSYLGVLRAQDRRFYSRQPAYSDQSLAADAVADLFMAPGEGVSPHFKKFLLRNTAELQSPSGCLMILRRVCGQRMQQYLRICFYETDPEGAKLYRNLRLAAKRIKGAGLQKNIMGYLLVYPKSANDPVRKRPTLPELQRLVNGRFQPSMNVDELVEMVLKSAFAAFRMPVSVELMDLYHLIRDFRTNCRISNNWAPALGTWPLQYAELQSTMEEILASIRDTILERYCRDGKLTRTEAVAMYAALGDMARDMALGEMSEKNYSYVQRYWPALSEADYYSSTRKVYEYLVRILKERIEAASKLIF